MAKASYSNKAKGAPKAKTGTGLSAAQHYLGLVQNAQGQWVRPGAALATKTMQTITENLGYQPGGTGTGRGTPLATPKTGQRLGFVNSATGQFSLAGGGRKTKATRGRSGAGHGAAMAGVTADSIASTSAPPFAEADIAQTSLLGAQGKAYAAGRQGTSGTLLGATSKPVMPEAKAGQKRGGKKRGRKGKGKAKGRKH
jgi:hypothetical protein